MLTRTLAAAALVTSLTGCFFDSGPRYPGPGPGPIDPGPVVIVGTAEGRPAANTPVSPIAGGVGNIDPGTPGYIITANSGSFRITWAGYQEFRGSIFADPRAFGRLFPGCRDGACALVSGEDVVQVSPNEGGRIDFVSFPASGKRSGFDIEVLDNLLYVDLMVNGQRRPDLTLFASVDQRGQPFQAHAQFMPLGLDVNLPQSKGEEPVGQKVVKAPLPASQWPEAADPAAKGAQILKIKGMEDAQSVFGSEALLNYRGKADQPADK